MTRLLRMAAPPSLAAAAIIPVFAALASGAPAIDPPVLGDPPGPPPAALSEAVRGALAPDGVQVLLDSGSGMNFWFVSEPPGGGGANPGATFGALAVGTLVGAVEITGPWTDYKGNRIQPGVFTLRYGVRPEDGNHMGVSVHLDFALLLPAEEDQDPAAAFAQDDINILSFGSTGIGHPGVMSLAPDYAGLTEAAIFSDDAGGFALAWVWEGLTLGFVVEGEGEH